MLHVITLSKAVKSSPKKSASKKPASKLKATPKPTATATKPAEKPAPYHSWIESIKEKLTKPKKVEPAAPQVTSQHLEASADGRKALRQHVPFKGYSIHGDGVHHLTYEKTFGAGKKEQHHVLLFPDGKASHVIRVGATNKQPVQYSKDMKHSQLGNHLKKVSVATKGDKVHLGMKTEQGNTWATPVKAHNQLFSV